MRYLDALLALLPAGPISDTWRQADSHAQRLLDAFAASVERFHAYSQQLIEEASPASANQMLRQWEVLAGLPNPCTTTSQTVEQRRAAVMARLTQQQSPTPAGVIAQAARIGYTVELEEYHLTTCLSDCLRPLYTDEWAHALGVRGPRTAVSYATCLDECMTPLAIWGATDLECAMGQLLPAHVAPIYKYGWEWDGAWFEVSDIPVGRWYDLIWSDELGIFVAVAYTFNGSGNLVMTSPDGVNWTVRTAPRGEWSSVAWAPELGLFVAVAYSYLDYPVVMTSPNGVTWTPGSAPPGGWSHLIWVADLGLFLATGYADPEYTAMTSPDGVTWTGVYSEADLDGGLCWNPDRGELLALDYLGTHVYISRDTRSWTSAGTIGAPGYVNVLYHAAAQLYVAFSLTQQPQPANGAVWTSPDGQVWSPRSTPDGAWADGIYVDAFGEVVLVGYGGAIRSADGHIWSAVSEGLPDISLGRWSCLGWSPTQQRLVALTDSLTHTSAILSAAAT